MRANEQVEIWIKETFNFRFPQNVETRRRTTAQTERVGKECSVVCRWNCSVCWNTELEHTTIYKIIVSDGRVSLPFITTSSTTFATTHCANDQTRAEQNKKKNARNWMKNDDNKNSNNNRDCSHLYLVENFCLSSHRQRSPQKIRCEKRVSQEFEISVDCVGLRIHTADCASQLTSCHSQSVALWHRLEFLFFRSILLVSGPKFWILHTRAALTVSWCF